MTSYQLLLWSRNSSVNIGMSNVGTSSSPRCRCSPPPVCHHINWHCSSLSINGPAGHTAILCVTFHFMFMAQMTSNLTLFQMAPHWYYSWFKSYPSDRSKAILHKCRSARHPVSQSTASFPRTPFWAQAASYHTPRTSPICWINTPCHHAYRLTTSRSTTAADLMTPAVRHVICHVVCSWTPTTRLKQYGSGHSRTWRHWTSWTALSKLARARSNRLLTSVTPACEWTVSSQWSSTSPQCSCYMLLSSTLTPSYPSAEKWRFVSSSRLSCPGSTTATQHWLVSLSGAILTYM